MIDAIRALSSAIADRLLLSRRGNVYGQRNYSASLGYPLDITAGDFRAAYNRWDIAARIVEAKPEATWSDGVELIEDEDPKRITAFEAAFNELNTRLNIWSVFYRADVLSGIGRYAVILIGAPGLLESPIQNLNANQIAYLQVFSEEDALILKEDLIKDPANPRFGQPEYYRIKRMSENGDINRRVHWTRCVHIAENQLDDILYGQPRLERIWNQLINLMKVVGGGSEAFWIRVNPGIQFDMDPNALAAAKKDTSTGVPASAQVTTTKVSKQSVDNLREQVDNYVNGIDRVLRTSGMKINVLDADTSDFGPNATTILSLIAGATGIPQRILLGSERGQLASQQDSEHWDDRISDRRAQYAGPYIVRPFIQRLIEFGALPAPATDLIVRWPDLRDLTEKEKAEIAERMASANAKQIASFGTPILSSDEIRDKVWNLEPLDLTEWERPQDEQDEELDDNVDEDDDDEQLARAATAATVTRFPRVLSQRTSYRR